MTESDHTYATNMTESKHTNTFELTDTGVIKDPSTGEALESGVPADYLDISDDVKMGFTQNDQRDMRRMGKEQQFRVSHIRTSPRNHIDLT